MWCNVGNALPECKGKNTMKWTNCFGTIDYVKAYAGDEYGIYEGEWKDGELHGKGTHTDGLMPKENKISVSKESVGRGAKSLSNIVAIFFGLGGATTGMFLGSSTYWLTIVGAIIGFLIVYYFWKFVFWGLRSLISEFFN